jgi:hypothetical protein
VTVYTSQQRPWDYTLTPGDVDLLGDPDFYLVEPSSWRIVRTPLGWRPQQRPKGYQKRLQVGPAHPSPEAALRWLCRHGKL